MSLQESPMCESLSPSGGQRTKCFIAHWENKDALQVSSTVLGRIGEETGFYPGVPAFAAMAPLTERMDISSGESGLDLAEGLSLRTEVKT